MSSAELDNSRRAEEAGKIVMTARMNLRRGQRSETKKLLAQALKIDPSDISALDMLGDMFFADGEQEKAIQVFTHGLKFHPEHAVFEEKLALAKLDIAEMERDQVMKESALQNAIENGLDPGFDKLLDKKPSLALGLSAVVPGAGQFYNDEWEKAGVYFVLWLASVCAWSYPLMTQMRALFNNAKGRRVVPGIGDGIAAMSGAVQFFFWLMLLTCIGVIIASAIDATVSATRLNEARRRELGLLGD